MTELRALMFLAGPLILTQLGQMALGLVDVMLIGHLGVHALDAATLGNVYQSATMFPLFGVVIGLDPLVSQAHGAGRGDDAGLALQRALLIACVLAVPLAYSWTYTEEALVWLGQAPELARTAELYTRAQCFTAPAFLAYGAFAVYLSSRSIVRPGMVTMLIANLFNALAAWALIFGKLGLPAWGVFGAGVATGLTRVVLSLGMAGLVFGLGLHRGAWTGWSTRVFALRPLVAQLALGLPIGLTMALEIWAFQLGTLIAGRIDALSLAAHSVVISLASFTFMVPLGLAMGASARVGQLIGAGESARAQRAAHAALALAGGFALASALAFTLGRHVLPELFSRDAAMLALAAQVMPIAGAFQLMDGLQAVSGGILRGMGRPRVTAAFNLLGYFAVGTPLAYYLALYTDLRLRGVWLAYAVALTLVAFGLTSAVVYRGPRTVRPLPSP